MLIYCMWWLKLSYVVNNIDLVLSFQSPGNLNHSEKKTFRALLSFSSLFLTTVLVQSVHYRLSVILSLFFRDYFVILQADEYLVAI